MNKEDKDKIIMIFLNRYNINPSAGERMLDDIQPVIEQQLKAARADELRNQIEFFMSVPDAGFTDLFIKRIFENELESIEDWLVQQENISLIKIQYKDIIENALQEVIKIETFLDLPLNKYQMTKVVDPKLYRNRLFI